MVIDPHNADEGETEDKSKIRGPLTEKLNGKISAAGGRNLDLQNQQSNGNGKNAVREGFDTCRFFFHWKLLDPTRRSTGLSFAQAPRSAADSRLALVHRPLRRLARCRWGFPVNHPEPCVQRGA